MTVLHHLPGIILREDGREFFTMASACGKKGPIRTRDASETHQAELFQLHDVCPDCIVSWDAAEETGAMLALWHSYARSEWQGAGAVLFTEVPKPWRCRKCGPGGGHSQFTFHPVAIAVVVRDQRPKVKRKEVTS